MPESIPAGFEVVKNLNELDSLLIVDLGGTTLDISQVMGKMRGISRIYGDSTLGVSLMTGAVRDALSLARTKGSSYLADDIIIHRNDAAYLASRINDTSRIDLVCEAMTSAHSRLVNRVIEAVSRFEGYSHVMVIGGGAELIAEAVKNTVQSGKNVSTKPVRLSSTSLTVCTLLDKNHGYATQNYVLPES